MRIDIFDVGHGNCALVSCPNGARIMVDCGYLSDPGWFPSVTFAGQFIDLLVFSNLDEDHVDDLPYIWRDVPLGSIFSNPSVTAPALAAMKPAAPTRPSCASTPPISAPWASGKTGTSPSTTRRWRTLPIRK